ncbi:hypothetical protein CFELI_01415 [Corynebacterium felinum]|uniref:DUF4229 domain-containing protein n=1 Tax=Corynebacterium felinum TaxID=131318 RepID=A0ABU2B7I0_9CORY|nr:hypothetical protein [Corynebacterium felinum]WJY93931.1 hypothetical protein CFELI_01415 [Corynebacterium felinum]
MSEENTSSQPPVRDPHVRAQATKSLFYYGAARLVLFLALTAVIQLCATAIGAYVPIFISAMLALIVAMPLSVFLFKGLRVRATMAVAQWHQQRKAYKEWVKAELSTR